MDAHDVLKRVKELQARSEQLYSAVDARAVRDRLGQLQEAACDRSAWQDNTDELAESLEQAQHRVALLQEVDHLVDDAVVAVELSLHESSGEASMLDEAVQHCDALEHALLAAEEEFVLCTADTDAEQNVPASPLMRASAWTHHIYNRNKKRDIGSLAEHLCVSGIVKHGQPGLFCVEGSAPSVREFFRQIKRWKWKAFALRKQSEMDPSSTPVFEFKGIRAVEHMQQFKHECFERGLDDFFYTAVQPR